MKAGPPLRSQASLADSLVDLVSQAVIAVADVRYACCPPPPPAPPPSFVPPAPPGVPKKRVNEAMRTFAAGDGWGGMAVRRSGP